MSGDSKNMEEDTARVVISTPYHYHGITITFPLLPHLRAQSLTLIIPPPPHLSSHSVFYCSHLISLSLSLSPPATTSSLGSCSRSAAQVSPLSSFFFSPPSFLLLSCRACLPACFFSTIVRRRGGSVGFLVGFLHSLIVDPVSRVF